MNEIFSDIFGKNLHNEILLNGIKNILNVNGELHKFTKLPVDLSDLNTGLDEDFFTKLLLSKIAAQTTLNMYYNDGFYEKCKIIYDTSNIIPYVDDHDVFDNVIQCLVQYIVLFQALLKVESLESLSNSSMKKDGTLKICEYCENVLNANDKKCSICDMYIDNDTISPEFSSNHWICPVCTFNNQMNSEDCEACFSRTPKYSSKPLENKTKIKVEDSWTCSSCTFKNTIENNCCMICYSLRNQENTKRNIDTNGWISKREVQQETWKCTFCNQDNLIHKYICESCKRKASFFDLWRCEKCSYFNKDSYEQCMACNHHKKNEGTNIKEDGEGGHVKYIYIHTIKFYYNGEEKEYDVIEYSSKDSLYDTKYIMWICHNTFCNSLNELSRNSCGYCKLKKGTIIQGDKKVNVYNGEQFQMMQQCHRCGEFNHDHKCSKCDGIIDKMLWYFEPFLK